MIHLTRCCSIPHAIATVAIELARTGGVPEVHFGWSAENPVTANLHFVLLWMGNVPRMARRLARYEEAVRPKCTERPPRAHEGAGRATPNW